MNAHPGLRRSETDRIIAGACGGIAATLRTSTTLIRLLWVCLTLLGAVGLLLYLLLWLTLPAESAPGTPRRQIARQGLAEIRALLQAAGRR